MAKAKAPNTSSASSPEAVNSMITDAVTMTDPKVLSDMQQQAMKGVYEMMEIGMQNTVATQQLMQDSLSLMSGFYKTYFGSINGMTQHSWATYSSIWNDPWGLTKEKENG